MKKLLICMIFIMPVLSTAQEPGPELLGDIAANISSYKNKTVTMKLRLKNIDRIFERITFYDSKNMDIEFDISSPAAKEKLKPSLINSHEGMEYIVVFTVKDIGNLGKLTTDLENFSPAILKSLP